MSASSHHHYSLLERLHCPENALIFHKALAIIKPHSDTIANHFYITLLGNVNAAHFINNDIVKKRLRNSMAAWINASFYYRENKALIDEHINNQIKIGTVHSRIDLPMRLMDYGMFIIKNEVMQLLKNSDLTKDEQAAAMIVAGQSLDIANALINESYQGDMVITEKNSQAFKLQFCNHNLAVDCEKLRSSLSDWMRELLLAIQQERFDGKDISTIRHSHFGLWVMHKAKLFLATSEYDLLLQLLNKMDESVCSLIAEFEHLNKRKQTLGVLNHSVSEAMWLLENITKAIIDQDSGRDSLTRLFNRRYLETVLKHEIECSLQNNLTFGLLMLDIDFFKKVNDTYGHDAGDKVLMQLASILTHEVRAGDFIFRLGGEEFLIVLSDVSHPVLSRVGEKIRRVVESTTFKIDQTPNLGVTISIGAALHDGHPDFLRVIKATDEALYEAKKTGRNRVVAKPLATTYAELNALD